MPTRVIDDVPKLFRLWASGLRQAEVCEEMGIPQGSFHLIRQRYALPKRECDRSIDFSASEPPTPEEIAERAAAVRAGWTDEEREKRIVGRACGPVRTREYSMAPKNGMEWSLVEVTQ